ncbi:glucomannan 4-beta-mannosyltransferase 1 [Elaeis guineensis]|uniref:glucomannan 4-beta-mannosyltransferase n=1 Tax=Elaeis guineensis var. tenera TaxID=51953 RepID=A0A6I9S4Z8_ELAGV|nr:glucomannan 4-beta-mannosyltransferase 1 [Elaeis guineensis]
MEANNFHPFMLSIARACEIILSSPVADLLNKIGLIWRQVRAMVVIPVMKAAVVACLIMSVMVLVEKVSMGLISLYAKLFHRRPERIYKCDPIAEDEELGTLAYPMVLVQIPMYNEKEVYQLSIGAACNLSWPKDRIIIQILDDSTDLIIKDLVKKECEKWFGMGNNIKYETRDNRKGYKAGALKEGMKHSYVETCEYIAMFDADFQPAPDFLTRTVPFLVHNPSIALVQARWKFVNANECLMTRMQEMSMDYHFKVEQESGSTSCAFFGYNGTAGVWRIQAINEAGGWKDRTTVEDMDLAVRAGLGGWKMIYVGSIKVKSELPSTFKAYRFQQHRWSCGPANLFRKMLCDIVKAKKVSIWKKFYVIYSFFLARRVLSNFVTFFFYCVVIPLSVFFPEVKIPRWGMVYIPSTITILNAVGTPSSFHLIIFWILFENVMSLHRCKAVIIGLLEAGRANEWVVTEKLGDLLKTKSNIKVAKKYRSKFWERLHFLELGLAVYLMICACYDYYFRKDYYFVILFPQAMAFVIMGVGYIGTIIPSDN